MGYPGEDLSILQLLFALNNKLSEKVHPFDCSVPGAEKLSVYEHEVQTALATINRGVNAHRPVTRLPIDILVLIPTYFNSNGIQFDLIKLTHVCRYWRDTFVSAHSLWSTIRMDLPAQLLTLSLERSGSAPIQLRVNEGDYDRFVAIVPLYQKEYDTLWLDLGWDQLVSVSQLTSDSVSHLHVLSLNVTLESWNHAAPTHLLFSRASALQELTLRRDVSTILDRFRFPSLTILSLFCASSISQAKVLELLRISPGLKDVLFDFDHLTADETSSLPVLLQDLRRLWISAGTSGDSHLQLIGKLICPVAEDISVSAHPATTFGNLATQPFPLTWESFLHSSKVHAMELHVEKYPFTTIFSIRLHHGETSRFEVSFHFAPFSSGGLFPTNYDPRDLAIFQAAVCSLRALSHNGITRLSITGTDTLTFPSPLKPRISSIRNLLVGMENLENLTLSSGFVPTVCLVLTPQPIPPIVLCPSLDSVEILLPVASDSDGLVAELVAVSEARATVGHRIRNLTVIPPQVDNTLIDHMTMWDWNNRVA